jgi:hypothetical protein
LAPIHRDIEIETAIITLGREPGGGLVVLPDLFTVAHRAPIILAAARNNAPAICTQCTHRMVFASVDPARLASGAASNDLEDITHRCVQCGTRLIRTTRSPSAAA